MKKTIGYCGCHAKPKVSIKAKMTAVALLFPWSLLLIPAWRAAEFIDHLFGMCSGIHF